MTAPRLDRILQLASKLDGSVYSGRGEDVAPPAGDYAVISAGERYELALAVRELVQIVRARLGLA